jgi:hypothetical protein
LTVYPFTSDQFMLSGPAFGDAAVPSPLGSTDIGEGLTEGGTPMVASGLKLVPSSSNRFKKDAQAFVYVEVYDPRLASRNLPVGILFTIVNLSNGQKVFTSNTIHIDKYVHPGNPLVPVILNLPISGLAAGRYRLETLARDSSGASSNYQFVAFTVE